MPGLNGEQLNDAQGLVGTHAYSILDARELGLIPGLSLGAGLLGQTKLSTRRAAPRTHGDRPPRPSLT